MLYNLAISGVYNDIGSTHIFGWFIPFHDFIALTLTNLRCPACKPRSPRAPSLAVRTGHGNRPQPGFIRAAAATRWNQSLCPRLLKMGYDDIPSGYVKIAIENCPFIVEFPIDSGDFRYVSLPEGNVTGV